MKDLLTKKQKVDAPSMYKQMHPDLSDDGTFTKDGKKYVQLQNLKDVTTNAKGKGKVWFQLSSLVLWMFLLCKAKTISMLLMFSMLGWFKYWYSRLNILVVWLCLCYALEGCFMSNWMFLSLNMITLLFMCLINSAMLQFFYLASSCTFPCINNLSRLNYTN